MTAKIALPLIACLFFPVKSHAVLGEPVEPGLHAMAQATTAHSNVSVRFLDHKDNAVNVREYAGADGRVFAVKWRGNGRPNLPVLLGKYHIEYTIGLASATHRIRRRGLSVSTDNLEISQFGTMSLMHGYVILKHQMPPGMKANELP